MNLSVVGASAGTFGDDLSLCWPLLHRVGTDDAAGGLVPLLDPADEHTVQQWTELHRSISVHNSAVLVIWRHIVVLIVKARSDTHVLMKTSIE